MPAANWRAVTDMFEFLAGLVERVGVAFEQAQVGMHAGTWSVGKRLRHEAGVNAALQRNLFDDGTEGHDVVGRGERVRITQIDLVLAWTRLMMRVFHRMPICSSMLTVARRKSMPGLRGTWSK